MKEAQISNSEIIAKVNFGSTEKKRATAGGYFFYLYKTTCLLNGLVYVGATASTTDPALDPLLGEGIRGNKAYRNFHNKRMNLKFLLNKYGRSAFKREDLIFFDRYDDMVKAMELVVDEEFVKNERTLNETTGGTTISFPGLNTSRGNAHQKGIMVELSKPKFSYIKANGQTVSLVLIDCYSKDFKMEIIDSIKEAEIKYGYAKTTISIQLKENGYMLIEDRYMLMKLDRYSKFRTESLAQYINSVFESFKNIKKRRFIKFQVAQGKMKLGFDELKEIYPKMTGFNLKPLLESCK